INDDVVELRDAKSLVGLDTWETQNALCRETGLVGHQLSVYSIGPAGENLVRFAAIQGDFGHVASKNGCGAVMGKKRLKAVAIVKGTKALRAADPRGVMQAAEDMSHDLRTDASARSLYEYGTLPGVVNLAKIGAADRDGVAWLNTECDKACVDVNEWGWLCGWVMECQEKGYITREQVGFELKWGDIKGAHRLLQMVSRREGFGNILAEGVKRA